MAACTPRPTQTQYQTVITSSPSTSFSESVTTIPPVLTTISFESCLQPVTLPNSTVCMQSTEIVSVSTIRDAQTNTVQVPFTLEIPATQTFPTNTLFQSCPSSSSANTPLSSPPTSQHGSFVSSSVLILSTPPASTVVIPSSTTLANGQISVVYATVVYTQNPVSIYVPTTALVQETQGSSGGTPVHLGYIVGGSLGGVLGAFFIVAALWWIRKRRNKFDEIFEKTVSDGDLRAQALQRSKDRKRFDIDGDPQPKPYHYGLIGSPYPGFADDSSPVPPALGFSTATSVSNIALSEPSQPSSRRASTSAGSLAPFLSSNQKATSTTTHATTAVGSEERHGMPSPPPHVTMSFENWGEGEAYPVESLVSFEQQRTLKVVNQHDDEVS